MVNKTGFNNFIECATIEEANLIDLTAYTFLGFRKDMYVFKIRQR